MIRGYGTATGRGMNYNYRYAQPSINQYESFFNPVPLDFLQEELGRRQDRFDTSYAGALGAKDELAQRQVGLLDMADKNRIIDNATKDINKLVDEKYGGDWGKASKEVARQVTNVRANDFWNAQSEMQKKREQFNELATKYGPQAMIFGQDPRNMTTLDEQGKVRSTDQFGEVIQQGDWGGTARKIFSSLTPDMISDAQLSEAEHAMLRQGNWKGIKREKLEKLAKDPAIQQAFLQSHPEFARGFMEGDDRMKQQFGLQGNSINEAVEKTLLGNILPAAHSQTTYDFRQDAEKLQLQKARMDAAASASLGPITTTTETPITESGYKGIKEPKETHFSSSGALMTPAERLQQKKTAVTVKDLPLTGIKEVDTLIVAGKSWDLVKEALMNTPGPHQDIIQSVNSIKEYSAAVQYKKEKEMIDTIRQEQPNLADMTDAEVMNAKYTADKALEQQTGRVRNLGGDWQNAMSDEYILDGDRVGNMFQQQIMIDGKSISGTDKEKLFRKELNLGKNVDMSKVLKTARVQGINFTSDIPGELVVNVIDGDNKPRVLQIAPNDQVQALATPVKVISDIIRTNGTDENITSFAVNGEPARQIEDGTWIVPSGGLYNGQPAYYSVKSDISTTGTGSAIKGTYNPQIMLVDQNGNPIQLDVDGDGQVDPSISLSDIVSKTENSIRQAGVTTTKKNKEYIPQQ
jgi:hypothetical protein